MKLWSQFKDRKVARWYAGGDPVASAFFSSLSITFPAGETYFIESVKHYVRQLPDSLKREAREFVTQEALHTREHAAFNQNIEKAGYDITSMVSRSEAELAISKNSSPHRRLAITISLEHLTALYANHVLSCPEIFENAPKSVRDLWRWHAIEEIEHKGVAYDVFMWATKDWSAVKRYFFRTAIMVEVTLRFSKVSALNIRDFYQQDGLHGWTLVSKTLAFFLKPQGTGWRLGAGWLRWFKPGFHPWDHDDANLARDAAGMLDVGAS